MPPFKRYSYLLTGTFLIVILISLSFLGLQWRVAYEHERVVIQTKFSENATNLDDIVKSVTDQLQVLKINAEEDLQLASMYPSASSLRSQLTQDRKDHYQLLPPKGIPITSFSAIRGLGTVSRQSDHVERELNMMLRLNSSFKAIKENLQEVTWIYYISACKIMSVYPYTPDFDFDQTFLTLPFYTQALPENNPKRQIAWTDAYLDLAGQGMMVTANVPVYGNDTFLGTVAMDITLARLNQVIQNFDYNQGTVLISNGNQQLLAYPGLNTENTFEIQPLDTVLPTDLKEKADEILAGTDERIESIGSFLVGHKIIPGTPWHLILFVPKRAVYQMVAANGLLASLIPLLGLGICLFGTNRLLTYGFIRPARQLVKHIEQENQALPTTIPETLPQAWLPWFEAISQAYQENRNLLQVLELQLDNLKTTQLQLVQSEKMSALGNLVAGVAHEINNPLGFVTGNVTELKRSLQDLTDYIQLWEQTFPSPGDDVLNARSELDIEFLLEDLPDMLTSMKLGCDRIYNISKSLRMFARADTDTKLKVNIHEGIDSTLLILKYRLKANKYRPEIEVVRDYGHLPDINCFPGQLSQIFMNILANAIDMFDEVAEDKSSNDLEPMPQCIKIFTQLTPTQQVKISISDNGRGMSEETCAKVFDRDFTTKTVGKGTGLGLAIAYQAVVEKHNGSLTVTSVLNEGTEFLIILPIQKEASG